MIRRILFLGQKPVGERCLEMLLKAQGSNLEVCGVVTNVTKEVWWGSNLAAQMAQKSGIQVIPNEKRNHQAIETLVREKKVNTVVSVQHAWILPKELLAAVNYEALNLHNAKLPDYQGYNACNHAILNGDRTFTSTIHWMTEEVDAGEIAIEKTFEISDEETAKSLYQKATETGEKAFQELVDLLAYDKPIPKIPLKGVARMYKRNSIHSLREIANLDDPQEVDRKSRAFFFPPFEPAFFKRGGRKIYVVPSTYFEGE
jgi:methionyl-tRNA formyltransferase